MTLLAIFTTVFNTFWQAAAVAVLVWLALRYVRMNAATRCVIWWAVLGVVVLLPFAPRFAVWNHPRVVAAPVFDVAPVDQSEASAIAQSPAIVTLPEKPADKWPLAIFLLWAVVLAYRLARIGQSYLYLRRVKRDSSLSDLSLPDTGRNARLLLSDDIASPMAVGFLHAAIVLPESLIERITPGELDQMLLHESAHLTRRDDWWNLLARFLGAVLALHPVAWWIMRQIEYEREAACDDWVVARVGAVRPYAETLAHMAELRWEGVSSHRVEEALASGVFGSGSRIGDRIEKLLEAGRQFSARVSVTRVIVGCFVLCCLAAAGTLVPRLVAFAQTARFEVASIRQATFPSQEFEAGFYMGSMNSGCSGKMSISGTLVSLQRVSVCDLMVLAYGIRNYQIVDAPSLPQPAHQDSGTPNVASGIQAAIAMARQHASFFYDIEARAPGTGVPTQDDVMAMLRDLLADRFQLKLHHDTKEMSYYALVAGKKGIKMAPAKEDCKQVNNSTKSSGGPVSSTVHLCNQSMEQLVRAISSQTDKPVVDKTGLTGNFDYDLHVDVNLADGVDSLKAAYLDAYKAQLGLSLESGKGPVDVLVVDHVEAPSGN